MCNNQLCAVYLNRVYYFHRVPLSLHSLCWSILVSPSLSRSNRVYRWMWAEYRLHVYQATNDIVKEHQVKLRNGRVDIDPLSTHFFFIMIWTVTRIIPHQHLINYVVINTHTHTHKFGFTFESDLCGCLRVKLGVCTAHMCYMLYCRACGGVWGG